MRIKVPFDGLCKTDKRDTNYERNIIKYINKIKRKNQWKGLDDLVYKIYKNQNKANSRILANLLIIPESIYIKCNRIPIVPKKKLEFFKRYKEQLIKQKGVCEYCKKPGLIREEGFRNGKRGKSLELDRKFNEEYSAGKWVLACYICNNAKSDIFTHEEFKAIGKTIKKVRIHIGRRYGY